REAGARAEVHGVEGSDRITAGAARVLVAVETIRRAARDGLLPRPVARARRGRACAVVQGMTAGRDAARDPTRALARGRQRVPPARIDLELRVRDADDEEVSVG